MYKNRLFEDIEQIIIKHINEYYQQKYEDELFIDEADLFFDSNKMKMSPFDPDGGVAGWGVGRKTLQ